MSNCEEFEILVGEDKSTDNTRMLLKGLFGEDPSVRLYFNGKNKGIAENMKQLYRLARFRYILLYSADGEWGFGNIEALLKSMLLTKADMVIGKRVKKQGYTAYRLLISYLYNILPRLLFGVETFDAGSIKIYRRELLAMFPMTSRGVFQDAELVIRAKRAGAVVTTCPVNYKKIKKTFGTTANFRMILIALADMLRLRLSLS